MKPDKSKKAAALRYDQARDAAPRVVAKGRGKLAEKIVAVAQSNQIPLVQDENLMQMLDLLELDTQIPPELYQAVAEILAFVYRLNHESGYS
ncbi:MAG: EscU/YscU/HrcU family type III secretion system export apparatus switch protein [Desulfobacteraceae bacterium]|jgi:flagellar biosynthesis protein